MLTVNLRETITDQAGAPISRRDYLGPVIYQDGVIQFIQHADGRVVPGSGCTNDLHVGGAVAGAETHEAGNITTDATVLPMGELHLKAGRDIRLEPGFTLEAGGYLRAEQVVCYSPVGEWRFEYFLADHLGNNRVLFSDLDGDGRIDPEGEVLQESHYYAFGLEMEGEWTQTAPEVAQRYKFNGIERNDDLGLDLAFYRSYDPTIGRWMQIDPMAEKYPGMTPYNGMGNNPILYSDPMGDTLRLNFPGVHGGFTQDIFQTMVDRNLEGQFETQIGEDGTLSIIATEGGGDLESMSLNGQEFHRELTAMTTGEGVANITVDMDRSDVHTGNFESGVIDISDIGQFNESLSQLGGTQGGKIMHEFAEQYSKQTGVGVKFAEAHSVGIQTENNVNLSTRRDDGYTQKFSAYGRTVRNTINTQQPGSGLFGWLYSTNRPVIQVRKH